MDIIDAVDSTSQALNNNAEIAQQIKNTNQLLNYMVVNLMWIIVFGMIVLLGLLVFLIVKNKKDSRTAALESLESIFGSEGILLKKLFEDVELLKKEISKIDNITLENKALKDSINIILKNIEKNEKVSYNITTLISQYNAELKEYLNFVKINNIETVTEILQNTKKYFDEMNKSFDNHNTTLQTNINETVFNIGKKFFENNKETVNEIQKMLSKIDYMNHMFDKNKEYSDEDLIEILYANSALIILTIQITMIAAISYPVDELENGKELLYTNLDAIFSNSVFKSRNRLKIKNCKIQFVENEVDKIVYELKQDVKNRLDAYFNGNVKNEIENIRTIRAFNKLFDNSLTRVELSIKRTIQ